MCVKTIEDGNYLSVLSTPLSFAFISLVVVADVEHAYLVASQLSYAASS